MEMYSECATTASDTYPGRGREQVNDSATALVRNDIGHAVTSTLLDAQLPSYDVALTEHLVIQAGTAVVFEAAKNFDFITTRSPFVTLLMSARSVPSRLHCQRAAAPQTLMLARDAGALPGWLLLGEVPGREVVFGAVGTFWKSRIDWRELAADEFAAFTEPGWGKIACHLLVRPDGPGRSILTYECRTATTDAVSQAQMGRYWWLIRPFVGYVLRAVLRTIRGNVDGHA
jgi:hypothetical protein